jgi:hypothetical protein
VKIEKHSASPNHKLLDIGWEYVIAHNSQLIAAQPEVYDAYDAIAQIAAKLFLSIAVQLKSKLGGR